MRVEFMGGGLAENGWGEKGLSGGVNEGYTTRHRERTRSDPDDGESTGAAFTLHPFKKR